MMLTFRALGWKFIAAIVVLIVGVACFAGYETFWLGTTSLNFLSPQIAVISSPSSACRVAILRSEYTSKFFKSPTNYNAHVEFWRKVAKSLGMQTDVITDNQLEEGLQEYRVLLIPSAICLGQREKVN